MAVLEASPNFLANCVVKIGVKRPGRSGGRLWRSLLKAESTTEGSTPTAAIRTNPSSALTLSYGWFAVKLDQTFLSHSVLHLAVNSLSRYGRVLYAAEQSSKATQRLHGCMARVLPEWWTAIRLRGMAFQVSV